MELIDKSAIVAEINRRIKEHHSGYLVCLKDILSLLDTLEVKEVDLENSVKGTIEYPFIGYDYPNIYPNYKELKDYCDKNRIMDNDKVKLIIVKEDMS